MRHEPGHWRELSVLLRDQPVGHLSIQHRCFDSAVSHDAMEREHIAAVEHVLRTEGMTQRVRTYFRQLEASATHLSSHYRLQAPSPKITSMASAALPDPPSSPCRLTRSNTPGDIGTTLSPVLPDTSDVTWA